MPKQTSSRSGKVRSTRPLPSAIGAIAACALAFGATALHAADKKTEGYYPPRPKPAAALDGFAALVGNWQCKGTLPAGAIVPGAPAADYASTIRVTSVLDGFAYQIDYEQRFLDHPMVFKGTWHAGYDDIAKSVTFFWLDNMGTVGRESSAGWQGDSITLTGAGSVPASSGSATSAPVQLRDTFTRIDGGTLHWKGEMQMPGTDSWRVLGDDSCKRSG